jgi:hypothetical protein
VGRTGPCPTQTAGSKPGEAYEVTRGRANRIREVLRGHGVPDAAVREKATLFTDAADVRLGPVVHIQDVDSDKRPKPLHVWLNPEHGPALASLPFELVWATTREDAANGYIGPIRGLPHLLVIEALPGLGQCHPPQPGPVASH